MESESQGEDPEVLLRIEGLEKRFGDLEVLKGVSTSIRQG